MSKTLSSVASKQFDSEVKQAYQSIDGVLRPTIRVRTGVVGDEHNFRLMGRGKMQDRGAPQTDVTPMNVGHSLIPVTLQNKVAPEYTDIFDQAEVNFDEQQELAMAIAGAMHRQEDQFIIGAWDAGTYNASPTATQGIDIPAGGTGLTADKVRKARTALGRRGVSKSDRCIVHSTTALEVLLSETEATSSDYANVKALVQGDVDTFIGFKFVEIDDDREEGGLPANVAYAYHKASTGIAIGLDMDTDVNWIPEKVSWLCNGMYKANAVIIDNEGVARINLA